jgi:DNA-3-methyladenine glycosylase I
LAAALQRGDDGRRRCSWGAGPDFLSYHDHDWGRPVTSDDGIFERLCLEAFQSGLSWLTILRKRESFRSAFADFRIDKVARFGPRDVERLMTDAGIIRNRKKIEAAVANAQAAAALDTPLAELAWGHRPRGRRPALRSLEDLPSATPESTALARELKERGFRFVGPTTAYALMQACGIVNDHVAGCWVRAEVERERRLAIRSAGL